MMSCRDSLRVGIACFSSFGGSGVVATEIGMALGRRGHRVCFLSDKPPTRLNLDAANVSFHEVALLDYPLVAHRSFALALTAKMIEVSRAEKLDLLHVHYAVPHAISAVMAKQILGSDAPKVVTTLHGTDVTLVGADHGFAPLTHFAVTSSDAVTTPSRWLAETARTNLGLASALRIDVIPNFVDPQQFSAPPRRARNRPPVLIHVSNFRPIKRVHDVVGIFAAVRKTTPCRLELVGDGPERSRVESLVRDLGLQDHVSFRGERDDVASLYGGSDVFLLPSESESFGLAALEAMACGVPVVASDVGGLPDVVADGETGFLLPVGDVAAMAEAARRLLTDDVRWADMSRLARERARTCFTLDRAVDRYEATYRRVLG
jgi:N-acetyl-alpha-D-glucosaminyl L-malate synthase BshA